MRERGGTGSCNSGSFAARRTTQLRLLSLLRLLWCLPDCLTSLAVAAHAVRRWRQQFEWSQELVRYNQEIFGNRGFRLNQLQVGGVYWRLQVGGVYWRLLMHCEILRTHAAHLPAQVANTTFLDNAAVQIINATLSRRDVFVLMPTGQCAWRAGKPTCASSHWVRARNTGLCLLALLNTAACGDFCLQAAARACATSCPP